MRWMKQGLRASGRIGWAPLVLAALLVACASHLLHRSSLRTGVSIFRKYLELVQAGESCSVT